MSDIASDIAAFLAAQGFGVWKDANPALNSIFIDEFVDLPDNQIAIFVTGGREPEHEIEGSPVDYPSFDVQVRNLSKNTARTTAQAILELLDGNAIGNLTCWAARSKPDFLGKDGVRYRYLVEFWGFEER